MPAAAVDPIFTSANPHALATILEASETKSIIASRDIFDIGGIKLWARDQPVSAELQRKLLDRQLRNPLESCLMAEDGVSGATLVATLQSLLDGDSPLVPVLRPHAAMLLRQTAALPLHSVAQLLLTAGQASRPQSFRHAVEAMALAGVIMLAGGGSTPDVRLAMLGGLLHDLGEMYIDPRFGEADADRSLDLVSYRQLVVHPHVGHLLIHQLTDYPKSIAWAIAEHHERLDGTGYPRGLERDRISPLGRLLAVTDETLAALRRPRANLARASVSLRVVPGEFDLGWIGLIADAARAQPQAARARDAVSQRRRLELLDAALQQALQSSVELAAAAGADTMRRALALTRHLLERLRTGFNASGLWSNEVIAEADAAEVEAVEDELSFRLRAIERAARLSAGAVGEADAQRLDALSQALRALDR